MRLMGESDSTHPSRFCNTTSVLSRREMGGLRIGQSEPVCQRLAYFD